MCRPRVGRVRGREIVHTIGEGFCVGVIAKVEIARGRVGQCGVELLTVFETSGKGRVHDGVRKKDVCE